MYSQSKPRLKPAQTPIYHVLAILYTLNNRNSYYQHNSQFAAHVAPFIAAVSVIGHLAELSAIADCQPLDGFRSKAYHRKRKKVSPFLQ